MAVTRNGLFSMQTAKNAGNVVGGGLSMLFGMGAVVKDVSMQAGMLGGEIPSPIVGLSIATPAAVLLSPDKDHNNDNTANAKLVISYLYRGYNAATAALVAYDYMTNPSAAADEYLPDIAIHLFEAICPESLNKLALGLHLARGLQASHSFWTGVSSIPSIANFTDAVVNHAWSISRRLQQASDQQEKTALKLS